MNRSKNILIAGLGAATAGHRATLKEAMSAAGRSSGDNSARSAIESKTVEGDPLPEITKEIVEGRMQQYIDLQTKQYRNSKFKKSAAIQIRKDMLAGYLLHSDLLQPHNEDLMKRFDEILHRMDRAKDLIKFIDHADFSCKAGPLANCNEYIQLKELLGL
jgi:hypothetical protein